MEESTEQEKGTGSRNEGVPRAIARQQPGGEQAYWGEEGGAGGFHQPRKKETGRFSHVLTRLKDLRFCWSVWGINL